MNRLRNLHPAWIAAAIGTAVVLWIASGTLGGPSDPEADAASQAPEAGPVKVRVRESRAAPIMREAVVSGRTAPVRSVTVRAETSGRVAEVVARRGGRVEGQAVIVRLAPDDRRAQLRQAEAIREQRRLQYRAAERMQSQGYQTEVDLAQARANLEAAEAEVERIRQDLAHTVIKAPFAGILETRPVEQGDFVSVGDVIGRVIDQEPFVVRGDVSEDVVAYLEEGQDGSARLVDGREVSGTLRYIASDADEETRTYRVELEVPNPDGRLISGASADMRLPLEEVVAHEVEPAILTLNEAGEFGIKSVDGEDRVRFHPADIVRNRDGKVWLTGLPESLRIISVGQGFVTAGDVVAPTDEAEAADPGRAAGTVPEARP